ncbi:MAG: MATE family efflux transporter [Eubacteriales bacterium]|jgi:putative MATE family efflux protein
MDEKKENLTESQYNAGSRQGREDPAAGARTEDKMGTMPVGKLLFSMAMPMMISFFIQAMYNIVDSMFVAQISENALTAVSLAYPMYQVLTAIGVGTGVGISAVVPREIALGRQDKADEDGNTGIFLCLLYWVIFLVLGLTIVPAYFRMQTDVEEIIEDGTVYLTICWTMSGGVFFGNLFEKMLTGSGNALPAMASQATGAVFNIIFDPLLIFGIGPFPELGIAGAALATVFGLLLGATVAFLFNRKKNDWVHFHIGMIFRPKGRAIRDIYAVGFPSMITIGLYSIGSFFINQILLVYSTTATAVYGIWLKLQNFCFMPAFGMNNGMVPILSYNHARGHHDRVQKTVRLAVTVIVGWMLFLTILLELIPGVILKMFNASDNMLAIGMPAIRIAVLSLVVGGISIILSTAMQALQHARYTLAINILRQAVLPVAFFAALSAIFADLNVVWAAIPLAELLTVVVAVLLYRRMVRQVAAADKS